MAAEFVASSSAGLENDGHGATSAGGGLMLAADGFGNRGTCGSRNPISLLTSQTNSQITKDTQHTVCHYTQHLPNILQFINESPSIEQSAHTYKSTDTSVFRDMCPRF
jgi:hypothetical protein